MPHRGIITRNNARLHREDPYIPQTGWSEPTICTGCQAIFTRSRWSIDPRVLATAQKSPKLQKTLCPGCRKVRDHYVMGELHLEGDFLQQHRDEITKCLRSEEQRAREKNPLERVIKVDSENSGLLFETTSDQLALRLGRFLHRTYSGDIQYKFSSDQKQVRVFWKRDLEKAKAKAKR